MSTPVTLYREIEALGGAGTGEWHAGYVDAISEVLNILQRRGFTEFRTPYVAVLNALTPILDDLGVPGSDGWTSGYAHVTDIDRLQAAIAKVEALA